MEKPRRTGSPLSRRTTVESGAVMPGATKNGARRGPVSIRQQWLATSLDLRFLELDVLARDRVILLLDQLVGHGARVLLGDVIEAGIRRGNELDLDGDRFGHVQNLKWGVTGAGQTGLHLPRNLASDRPKSRFSGQKPA